MKTSKRELGQKSGVQRISRRVMLSRSAATVSFLIPSFAFSDERLESARAAIAALAGDRLLEEGGLILKTPAIAENGNTVPVSIEVDAPFTADRYVEAIHLIAERNPSPNVASFFFAPANGRAHVSTRIRLAKTQRVIAVAELSDGRVLTAANDVKVTIGGCGG